MSGCVLKLCTTLPRVNLRELHLLRNLLLRSGQNRTNIGSAAVHMPSNRYSGSGMRYYGSMAGQRSQKQTLTKVDEALTHPEEAEGGDLSVSSVDEKYVGLYEGIKELHMQPAPPSKSANLAVYVNQSETLSNLVKLGVNLTKLEKHRSDANHIMKMDFELDVKPYLTFLVDMGIKPDELGAVITRNPGLLLQDLDHLHVRMNYLESKKFSAEGIGAMIRRAPELLSWTTKQLDTQLGYLQREFKLSGDEVRTIVTRYPKLAVCDRERLKSSKFNIQEFLGFTGEEQKQLLLEFPRVFVSGERSISDRFDFLHNVMNIPHELILRWPRILGTRAHIIRQRHAFLCHQGRNQYDPTKPNYVSLKALVTGTDVNFCQDVAKGTVTQYNEFLKTL